MNTYRNTSARDAFGVEPGDTFEADFNAVEESDLLDRGLVQIVPCEYRVIGGREVHGTKSGDTFKAPLTVHEEQLLVEAGHVERVAETGKPLDKMNLAELREHAEKVGVQADKLTELAKPGTSKADVRAAIGEALTA